MKNLFPVFISIALFAACNKSTPHSNPLPASTRLVAVTGYAANVIIRADTFTYSNTGNLLTQREWSYTNGVSDGDTLTVAFTYNGGQSDPVSYTITDGLGVNTFSLTYDNQGRIMKDTVIPDAGSRASTFSYPNNNISFSSADNGSADTFYISAGNIVKIDQASIPFDPNNYDVTTFTYSSLPNPFYYTGQTSNVRLLLTKIDGWEIFLNDCVSQNVPSHISDINGYSADVTNTTDGSGRVITESTLFETLKYNYK
jgi:hypothetical protein